MNQDKEHPALLWYAFGFFLLLAVASYLMLTNIDNTPALSDGSAVLKVPSYQNLFSPK
ncbi:MAG: hypothetical protein Q8Q05_00915 [bacterium]|nr:hypothetical protein [bacterium]